MFHRILGVISAAASSVALLTDVLPGRWKAAVGLAGVVGAFATKLDQVVTGTKS
jgi:hypothetical protein